MFPLENYSRLEHRLFPLILSGFTTLPIQLSRRAWRSPMRSARAGRGARIFSPEDPPPRSLLRPLSSSSLATFLVLPTLHSLQPCGWPHYAIAAHKDAKSVNLYLDSQLNTRSGISEDGLRAMVSSDFPPFTAHRSTAYYRAFRTIRPTPS